MVINIVICFMIWSIKLVIWNGSDGINGSRELSKVRI